MIFINPKQTNSTAVYVTCVVFFFPLVGRLKPLDVEFMKALHGKVNIVPVIAKADTLTLKERERLKRRVGLTFHPGNTVTHTMLKSNIK